MEQRMMRQDAPYPDQLAAVVRDLTYREHLGWRIWLEDDLVRDPATTHGGESRTGVHRPGLLRVTRTPASGRGVTCRI